jgi:hypothetical protein
MDAGIFDLYADFGTTYTVQFEYTEYNGTPIDLDQGVLSFYVKRSVLPYDTYFSVHSDGSILEGAMPFPMTDSGYGSLTIGTDGAATLEIYASIMSELQPLTYFYTLVYTKNNTETMLLKGKFSVEAA